MVKNKTLKAMSKIILNRMQQGKKFSKSEKRKGIAKIDSILKNKS